MKQLYSTFALLLIVAGVGGWIYYNETGPAAVPGNMILLRTEPSIVHTIGLQRPDGRRVTLTKTGEDWGVQQEGVHPIAVPADNAAVKKLLEATQLIQSAALVEDTSKAKAAEFGLSKPASTLLIDEAKIEFGFKPGYDASKIYARVTSSYTKDQSGGSRIALVPADLAQFPAQPFEGWRDKNAFRLTLDDVTHLELRAPALNAKFERVEKGSADGELDQWQVLSPVPAKADSGKVITFLQQMAQAKTVQFLEDNTKNLAPWGLDKPVATLRLTTGSGERSLRIGKKLASGRAAQNSFSNAVFIVPESLLKSMSRPLRAWRDKSILRVNARDFQALTIAARGRQAEFKNDSAEETAPNWKRIDAAGIGTDPKAASQAMLDIFLGLQGLAARDFIDTPGGPSLYGFDKPVLDISVTTEEWPKGKNIQFGVKNGVNYARVGEDRKFTSPVYKVTPQALTAFTPVLNVIFSPPEKQQPQAKPQMR